MFDTWHYKWGTMNCGTSWYPPFNTGAPPISLAYIDACDVGKPFTQNSYLGGDGGEQQANGLLWPLTNAYVYWITDPSMACILYAGSPPIENHAVCTFLIHTAPPNPPPTPPTFYLFLPFR